LPGKRVWLSARWDATELVFVVRDEGLGIPAEAQRRLFTPFERAGVCTTAGERSTGLGLAIARKIVEAHRGRLWVESTVGCGATFYVALQA
jgi:signal transduction histidine kinase